MDPTLLTVAEASRAIHERTLSPVALTEAYLERIDALDGELHSYVTVLRDAALDAAHAGARDIGAGRSRGTLHGIPIGLKDIYKTRGIRTTAGSRRYEHYVPKEDAESWVKLRNAGAILRQARDPRVRDRRARFRPAFPAGAQPVEHGALSWGVVERVRGCRRRRLVRRGDGVGHRRVDPRAGRL